MDHPALRIQRFQRGQGFARETYVAIGGVFQHDHIMPVGQFDQTLAALQRQGHAGRVLKIRHRIDHARTWIGRQSRVKRIHLHAVRIHRYRDIARLAGVEGDQRAQESRVFGHDDITRIDQHLCRKIKALLRSLQDQNILGAAVGPIRAHQVRDLFAQARQAVRGGILHRGPAGRADHIAKHLLELGGGEQAGIRIPTPEGNDRGVSPQRQKFLDGRRFDLFHPLREMGCHPLLHRFCPFKGYINAA